MKIAAFRLFRGAIEPLSQVDLKTSYEVVSPRAKTRPGKALRARLSATDEGKALLKQARAQLGELLEVDGVSALAALRLKAGLTQDDVRHQANMLQPQLSRLENGRTPSPTADTVLRLAELYGVTMEKFMHALRQTVESARD